MPQEQKQKVRKPNPAESDKGSDKVGQEQRKRKHDEILKDLKSVIEEAEQQRRKGRKGGQ